MASSILAFVGSYAEASSAGVYACTYNPETGALSVTDEVSGLQNPTFLDTDGERLTLYALAEATQSDGQRVGMAAAFRIDPVRGTLTRINEQPNVPAPICHITLDRTKRFLMVASFHGGMVGLSPVEPDGSIGAIADLHHHEGSSVLPVQDRPRAHSVFLDRANRYALACDLGLDQIIVYRLDADNRKLIPHGSVQVAPGSGPRHFAFHPARPFGYVINELNATITVFAYNEAEGSLSELQTVPTLPESYTGENACADIHISPDGAFLYGSNRGHDSIVVYAIDPSTGRLSLVEHASTLGGHPRNFALSPDGRFLLVANRDGNNIVTFARDEQTGRLTPAGSELKLSKPVCLKFLPLA